MDRRKTLHTLIYRSFLTSSLIPIFAIELLLILLYFGVSTFITTKSQETLYSEATQSLREITKREAYQINQQLQEVSRTARILQNDHELFFSRKDFCTLPHGKPEFAVHQNGAYYKRNDNGGSSLYYSSSTTVGETEKQKALCSEAIDPLMKSIVETSPIITQAYLNTWDDLNRLYPFMPDAPAQYGPVLNMEDYNFYYLADAKHNPERKPVWTGAYLDPAGQGWMISNVVPIYRENFLEGVSGLDVTIDSFIRNVLSLEIPWDGSAFMVDQNGMILAMSESVEQLLEIKELKEHVYKSNVEETIEKPEEYNIFKIAKQEIRDQLGVLFKKKTELGYMQIQGVDYLISQKIIAETGWRLMVLLDESVVYAPMYKLKDQTNRIGFAAITIMVVFYLLFFFYLLRKSRRIASKIADPIKELSTVTSNLGLQPENRIKTHSDIQEVEQLAQNFNEVSSKLDERTREYVQSQIREKIKEKDAEIAYRAGLFESASSYLHNVGNALAGIDSKVARLKEVLSALKKSGLGVTRVKEMVNESSARDEQKSSIGVFLDSFEDALSNQVTKEIEEEVAGIEGIKEHASQSIRHQQELFNSSQEASKSYVREFDIRSILQDIVENYHETLMKKDIDLQMHCPDSLPVKNLKFQFHSGLSNVVKNAIDALEELPHEWQRKIDITAERKDSRVHIQITDNGVGILPENSSEMFRAGFTTKINGHGLGLHAFNNFLNRNNGKIWAMSEGYRKGTTVYIEIGDGYAQ